MVSKKTSFLIVSKSGRAYRIKRTIMQKTSYYWINGITAYRAIAAPALLLLIIFQERELFKWFLAFSFFTDAIDGLLARKYHVNSVMGARLDSIADDLTVLVATIGLVVWHSDFIFQQWVWILVVLILFLTQLIFAWARYKRTTSFHTYLAKVSAVFQGIFLILSFFLPAPPVFLFHLAMVLTALDLIEETAMVLFLPKWQADIKGIYWALKLKK